MANCPQCQTHIEDDFGMVTCPGCQVVLSMDMEGNIEKPIGEVGAGPDVQDVFAIADEGAVVETDEELTSQYIQESSLAGVDEAGTLAGDDGNASLDEAYENYGEGNNTSFLAQDPTSFSETEEPLNPNTSEEKLYSDEGAEVSSNIDSQVESYGADNDETAMVENLSQNEEELAENSNTGGVVDDSNAIQSFMEEGNEPANDGPLDLTEFGNSESIAAAGNHLSYNLLISGIDSKEIRLAIRDAITDRRFLWDAQEIVATISDGLLRIDDLTALKCMIIVNRIKALPIKIHWKQIPVLT